MAIAIEPQGEIGPDDASLLRDRFIMVLAAVQPERIVVDLSDVPSISDAGLDALEFGYREAAAKEATVEVVNPAPQVQEQLRSHGLTGVVDDAVARDT